MFWKREINCARTLTHDRMCKLKAQLSYCATLPKVNYFKKIFLNRNFLPFRSISKKYCKCRSNSNRLIQYHKSLSFLPWNKLAKIYGVAPWQPEIQSVNPREQYHKHRRERRESESEWEREKGEWRIERKQLTFVQTLEKVSRYRPELPEFFMTQYTETRENIPNYQLNYQMAIIYSKWQ
jgi:hypothetical protein